MYFFLIIFLSLYGGMHLYVFFKLRNAFRPRRHQTWFLIISTIIMTIIPLLVRGAEQFGMEKTAQFIAWPGYIWMGFLFIFTTTLVITDSVRVCYHLMVRHFLKQLPEFASPRTTFKMTIILAMVASIYAFIEAGQIRSEHVVISTLKMPSSASRIRIVQISDVHIGLLMKRQRLEQIVEKVREANPDILVSTGDLIDGKLNRDYAISERDPLAALLATITAPSGKFAVIGNHEVYAGLPQALAFSRAAGFTLLRNQSIALKSGITVSGVDDRAVNPKGIAIPDIETSLFNSVSHDSFHLLLKHRPDIQPESDGRFDLQLSGHVHGGQIFPFNFLVKLKHQIPCGTTTTHTGSRIYVSRGAGTWGPPMRLFAPPEITILDIVRQ